MDRSTQRKLLGLLSLVIIVWDLYEEVRRLTHYFSSSGHIGFGDMLRYFTSAIVFSGLVLGLIGAIRLLQQDRISRAMKYYWAFFLVSMLSYWGRAVVFPPSFQSFSLVLSQLLSLGLLVALFLFRDQFSMPVDAETRRQYAATTSRRFFSFAIDLFVIVLFGLQTYGSGYSWDFDPSTELDRYVVMILFQFGYFWLTEGILRQSIGKVIMNTSVVSNQTEEGFLGRIFVRNNLRYIPLEPLSIFMEKGLFHDRFSGTTVIQAKPKDL